jgi:hypothetical protein
MKEESAAQAEIDRFVRSHGCFVAPDLTFELREGTGRDELLVLLPHGDTLELPARLVPALRFMSEAKHSFSCFEVISRAAADSAGAVDLIATLLDEKLITEVDA